MKFPVFCLGFCIALTAFGEGERRPFPQHTAYTAGTLKPSQSQEELDRAVVGFYKIWKHKYLRPTAADQLYVAANAEGAFDSAKTRSVSEGHGYGMLAAVLMAGADPQAHADFDALYRFFRAHPTATQPDLMAWRQIPAAHSKGLTEGHEDDDSATDGDLDIAYSLLLADRQWGSGGGIDYKAEALKVIAAILSGETDPARHILTLGNWEDSESRQWGALRSSDFMPGHLKAFAEASGDPRWTEITRQTYSIFADLVAEFSPRTGLLPDFIVPRDAKYAPAPARFMEGANDGNYAYNACRTPWRIGVDYLLSGDPRALALLKPLNAWVQRATAGDPAKINAGYKLYGQPLREDESAAFNAPFAVAAMADPDGQKWLDALWADLLRRDPGKEDYFGNSVKLLTLIVVSGNGW